MSGQIEDGGFGKPPMVSVIIPVRDDVRLRLTLDAIAVQDYPADRYEVIVCDNGSAIDVAASRGTADITAGRHCQREPARLVLRAPCRTGGGGR